MERPKQAYDAREGLDAESWIDFLVLFALSFARAFSVGLPSLDYS